MNLTVKTQGFHELRELFRQLPPQVADKVLATGVLAGARVIAKAAKKAAPRFEGKLSGGPKGTAAKHAKYGNLRSNIKAKGLRKVAENKRSAIVIRGRAFWGEFINRGTRYIAATRWYDKALDAIMDSALETQRRYMVAKITQLALKVIQQTGANRR